MKKRYCFIARSDLSAEGGLVECLKSYLLFVIPNSDPESYPVIPDLIRNLRKKYSWKT